MALHQLGRVQRLPIPVADAWRFFSDPRNLRVITPPEMGFSLRSRVPDVIHPGLIIEYTIRPFARVPVTWVTEITHVVEGRLFVDEQRSGPYRMWHHEHHFLAVPGGVEMRDLVSYTLPFGPLGDLGDRAFVQRRLAGIFAYREAVLRDRFGAFPGEVHVVEGV